MRTPRPAPFVLMALAFATQVAACGARAPVVAPVLPAPPAPTVQAAPPPKAPPPAASGSSAARACLDPARIVEAHACPPGPKVDLMDLMTETRRAAQAPRKMGREPLAPRPLTPTEAASIERAARFVCQAGPGDERSEARYMMARMYFDAHHWDEAAQLFHDNATPGEDDTAPYAAQLALESLNMLATHQNRPACFDLIGEWTNTYHETFCTAPARKKNEDLCETLTKILSDVQRLRGEQKVE